MSFLCFIEIIIFIISCFYVASSRNSCLELQRYSEEFFTEHKELLAKVSYLELQMKILYARIDNLGTKL